MFWIRKQFKNVTFYDDKPKYTPADAKDIKIKVTPVLSGLYHTYSRVA